MIDKNGPVLGRLGVEEGSLLAAAPKRHQVPW